jgi:putative transposase
MTSHREDVDTHHTRWARFRFSIVGPLLSSPPDNGELKSQLEELSKKQWRHPITGVATHFSFFTLERWFYLAKKANDPVGALRTKRRTDAAKARKLSAELKRIIEQQYHEHPGWSYQLHIDNLAVLVKEALELGAMPSYSTIYRYMKANGLRRQRIIKRKSTLGAQIAQERLEHREVRSFEVEYVHSLWHLDFHHGLDRS